MGPPEVIDPHHDRRPTSEQDCIRYIPLGTGIVLILISVADPENPFRGVVLKICGPLDTFCTSDFST